MGAQSNITVIMKYAAVALGMLLTFNAKAGEKNDSLSADRDTAPVSVGLVLSGGGAKGIAEIGVIKALEENNIHIDYITGTSMGAIVGGVYAAA